jgi:glycosyltransferase involved in cell wall biosynthesis
VKIVFAIKGLDNVAGGAERMLCKISNAMAEKGHDVSVVTFDREKYNSFYPLSKSIKCLPLGFGRIKKRTSLIKLLKYIYSLRKIILKEKPDIIIAFLPSMYVPMALSIVRTKNILIACEHSTIEYYLTHKAQLFLIKAVAPLINKITFLSKDIAQHFPLSLRSKSVILPNFVDEPKAVSLDKNIVKDKLILSVGRFQKQKRHSLLIDSFIIIAEKYPDWNLIIIGDGELRKDMIQKVKNAGLENRISFPGETTNVWSYYQQASIFVQASYYEGFGLAVAEAMLFQCVPVCFSYCSGVNELISSELNGVLVPQSNDETVGMAETLDRLIDDSELRANLGERARTDIQTHYHSSVIYKKWDDFLKDMS